MAQKASKKSNFKIEQLFGSKTRARLLGVFLNNPEQRFFVRELTRKIDAQLNSVRRELQNLIEIGIISEVSGLVKDEGKKTKTTTREKRKFYMAETGFVLFSDLRSLLKKVQLMVKKDLVKEIDSSGKIQLLILTGRFVDDPDIPVDLLVVGEIQEKALQALLSTFERDFGQEINFAVMTKDEFLYRKEVSDRFLYSILGGEHLVMVDRFNGVVI